MILEGLFVVEAGDWKVRLKPLGGSRLMRGSEGLSVEERCLKLYLSAVKPGVVGEREGPGVMG